jgi:hypothetical protein
LIPHGRFPAFPADKKRVFAESLLRGSCASFAASRLRSMHTTSETVWKSPGIAADLRGIF